VYDGGYWGLYTRCEMTADIDVYSWQPPLLTGS
jgi:hypothetical protein